MDSNPSEKRVAVVTGGTKRIGLEVCRQLASKGVVVVLTARDEKRDTEAAHRLQGSGLSDVVLHHELDVSDPSSAARLADFIRKKFRQARHTGMLVGKSATERLQWLLQRSTETYEEVEECLEINYFGTRYVTESLLPLLQASSDGRVVNVSSNYGLLRYLGGEDLNQELRNIENLTVQRLDEMAGSFLKDFENGQLKPQGWPADAEYLAYKVSKVLINGYTRIMAKNFPGMRINSVHPGYCMTDINYGTGELTAEEGASSIVTVAFSPVGGPTGVFFYRS